MIGTISNKKWRENGQEKGIGKLKLQRKANCRGEKTLELGRKGDGDGGDNRSGDGEYVTVRKVSSF